MYISQTSPNFGLVIPFPIYPWIVCLHWICFPSLHIVTSSSNAERFIMAKEGSRMPHKQQYQRHNRFPQLQERICTIEEETMPNNYMPALKIKATEISMYIHLLIKVLHYNAPLINSFMSYLLEPFLNNISLSLRGTRHMLQVHSLWQSPVSQG